MNNLKWNRLICACESIDLLDLYWCCIRKLVTKQQHADLNIVCALPRIALSVKGGGPLMNKPVIKFHEQNWDAFRKKKVIVTVQQLKPESSSAKFMTPMQRCVVLIQSS